MLGSITIYFHGPNVAVNSEQTFPNTNISSFTNLTSIFGLHKPAYPGMPSQPSLKSGQKYELMILTLIKCVMRDLGSWNGSDAPRQGLGWLRQLYQAEPLGILQNLSYTKPSNGCCESVLKVILLHCKIRLGCFLFLIHLRRFQSS